MLDALKKKLQGEVNSELQTKFDALQAEFEGYKATAEELLEAANAENDELKAKLASVEDLIAKAEAEKEAAEKAALEAKLNARKEKVVAAVGTDRADGLLAATESLTDEQFEAVVSSLAVSASAEAKSKMFVEQGAAVEAAADIDVDELAKEKSEVLKLLKAEHNIQ